jgi:hypothetical protein
MRKRAIPSTPLINNSDHVIRPSPDRDHGNRQQGFFSSTSSTGFSLFEIYLGESARGILVVQLPEREMRTLGFIGVCLRKTSDQPSLHVPALPKQQARLTVAHTSIVFMFPILPK